MESNIYHPDRHYGGYGVLPAPSGACETTCNKEALSLNETTVNLELEELSSYIRVVRPSRSSLTYERME